VKKGWSDKEITLLLSIGGTCLKKKGGKNEFDSEKAEKLFKAGGKRYFGLCKFDTNKRYAYSLADYLPFALN